jgi:hypothetical protein
MVTVMRRISFFLLLSLIVLAVPVASHAQVSVGLSIRIGPPALPVYVQPVCPAPGYIWTPGYWAYGPDGYYWVPGTWVEPPEVGVLWTPGYWGWRNGFYVWNGGYWGPHVGFYGGINYGFGYTGVGFFGGFWRGGVYNYNRSVTNVNVTVIHNTYNTTVINNNVSHTSFNGGAGGIQARPTSQEQTFARERHIGATGLQVQHQQSASSNRALLASVNRGQPSIAASQKPAVFNGQGVTAANKNTGFQKFSSNNGNTASSSALKGNNAAANNSINGNNSSNSGQRFHSNTNANTSLNTSGGNNNGKGNNNSSFKTNTSTGPVSRTNENFSSNTRTPPPPRGNANNPRPSGHDSGQNGNNHHSDNKRDHQ